MSTWQQFLYRSKLLFKIRKQAATTAVFTLRVPKQQLPVWAPESEKIWSGDQNQTRTIKSKYKQEQVFPQNTEQSSVPMAGKIKYLYQNWKVLTKDQWVCQVVQCTTLDFIQTPLPFWSTIFQLDQNRSSWPRNKIIVGERATKVVKDQKGFLI